MVDKMLNLNIKLFYLKKSNDSCLGCEITNLRKKKLFDNTLPCKLNLLKRLHHHRK